MSAAWQWLAAAGLVLAYASVPAVESDPLPVPPAGARADAVRAYNDGVALLVARNFGAAQARFEAALVQDESLAEAHNNLAYSLRMQGLQNFAAALTHYDRAIALKPSLSQAYLYRGAMFVQQGNLARAAHDRDQLRRLDPAMAATLEGLIGGADGDGRAGIAAQFEY